MKITTQSQAITIGNHARTFVRKRVKSALMRFDHAIKRVDVYLKDINGPKGGADKQVTVVVWMISGPRVAGETTDENMHAAVVGAVDKAKRGVRRAIGKAQEAEKAAKRRWQFWSGATT